MYLEHSSNIIPCPTCAKRRFLDEIRLNNGVPDPLREWTWTKKTTSPIYSLHQEAQKFAENPQFFFTIRGPYGCGKTGTLIATVNHATSIGIRALYITTAELLSKLKEDLQEVENTIKLFKTIPLLALDEFDRFNPTTWAQEQFTRIIEYRYIYGPQQGTMFATNLAISEIPGYVRSRMEDGRCKIFDLSNVGSLRK